jgi:hypothetical protein
VTDTYAELGQFDWSKRPKTPPAARLPKPVDHEVRPMTRPTMPAREREIRDECRALAEMDWDQIADRLVRMYLNDRTGTSVPDGRPTKTLNTDIPAADPEALTPTEQAVNARLFAGTGSKETGDKTGRLEPDPVHDAYVRARAALGQMTLALTPLMDNLNAGKAAQKPEKPGKTTAPCKLDGCEADNFKRGLCEADYWVAYRWEKDHNGEPIPLGEALRHVAERAIRPRRQPV